MPSLGDAPAGMHWHHIVEQCQSKKFGLEAIHNTKNVILVPDYVNLKLAGVFNKARKFSEKQRVRQWLESQSFDEQFEFGLMSLERILEKSVRERRR